MSVNYSLVVFKYADQLCSGQLVDGEDPSSLVISRMDASGMHHFEHLPITR